MDGMPGLAPGFSMWEALRIPDESTSAGQVIFDLEDFVPEEYTVRFGISGRKYEVRYQEARVDEVLSLLLASTEQKPPEELADTRRRYVTELFTKNLVSGDPAQLAEDLKLVPYTSLRGEMDIYRLYMLTQSRVKKNDLGELPVQARERRGFLGRLPFFSKRAKAV